MVNPYDSHPVQTRKVARMTEEFSALGVEVETTVNDGFVAYVEDGRVRCRLNSDFVLYFDKERIAASLIERAGIRVFNSAAAIEICDDKMLTHTVLANNGIPMPTTVAGPLCYNQDAKFDSRYIEHAIEILGLPIVVKECYGSFGEQVYLCDTAQKLGAKLEEIKMKRYLLQHFEKQSSGRDMRVIVIGGKFVCGMLRTSDGDFRSNAALGGRCERADVPADIVALCEKTARIIGLDYCGVDILLSDTPKVCEVNSNAMFEMMERATGLNVAQAYAKHIVSIVQQLK